MKKQQFGITKKKIFNPSQFKGKDLPVESVVTGGHNQFISRLNALTATTFRLPNNHEWEFAAKGGNKSKGFRYAGSDNVDEVAWYWGNRGGYLNFLVGTPHSVKAKKPNELGIYDMSGNVAEWCEDLKTAYYGESYVEDSNFAFVIRGGSINSSSQNCRVSKRDSNRSNYRDSALGFRLVLFEASDYPNKKVTLATEYEYADTLAADTLATDSVADYEAAY